MLCKVGQKKLKINAAFHKQELAHTPIAEGDMLLVSMFFKVKSKTDNNCVLQLDNKMGMTEVIGKEIKEDENS